MQLAPVDRLTTSAASLDVRNVHLVATTATSDPRHTILRTSFVAFDATGDALGGSDAVSDVWNGKGANIRFRGIRTRAEERAAAGAVLDAVRASGLLGAALPANDWAHPAPGRSRLYLDRRSRFLEFETARPPAVVQGVLDALAAYLRLR